MSERIRHIPTVEKRVSLEEVWAEYYRGLAQSGVPEMETQPWKDKVNARAVEEVFSGLTEQKSGGSRR